MVRRKIVAPLLGVALTLGMVTAISAGAGANENRELWSADVDYLISDGFGSQLEMSPDLRTAVIVEQSYQPSSIMLRVVDIFAGGTEEVFTIPQPFEVFAEPGITFSPDSQKLHLTWPGALGFQEFDLATKQFGPLTTPPDKCLFPRTFSRDGRWLACGPTPERVSGGYWDSFYDIFDTATGDIVQGFLGVTPSRDDSAISLQFINDSNTLVAAFDSIFGRGIIIADLPGSRGVYGGFGTPPEYGSPLQFYEPSPSGNIAVVGFGQSEDPLGFQLTVNRIAFIDIANQELAGSFQFSPMSPQNLSVLGFSPDDKRALIFDGSNTFIVQVDTGEATRLTHPAVSSGPGRAVYNDTTTGLAFLVPYDVYQFDWDTGDLIFERSLVEITDRAEVDVLSFNSELGLFSVSSGLQKRVVDGQDKEFFTIGVKEPRERFGRGQFIAADRYSPEGYYVVPAQFRFSPDGQYAYSFLNPGGFREIIGRTWDLNTGRQVTTELTYLSNFSYLDAARLGFPAQNVHAHPDGSVLYNAIEDSATELFTIDARSGEVINIAPISAESRLLIIGASTEGVITAEASGKSKVTLLDPDSGSTRAVITLPDDTWSRYKFSGDFGESVDFFLASPDGTRVLFIDQMRYSYDENGEMVGRSELFLSERTVTEERYWGYLYAAEMPGELESVEAVPIFDWREQSHPFLGVFSPGGNLALLVSGKKLTALNVSDGTIVDTMEINFDLPVPYDIRRIVPHPQGNSLAVVVSAGLREWVTLIDLPESMWDGVLVAAQTAEQQLGLPQAAGDNPSLRWLLPITGLAMSVIILSLWRYQRSRAKIGGGLDV